MKADPRYTAAVQAAVNAMSGFTSRHWDVDSLAHIRGMDVGTIARKLKLDRHEVLPMLAATKRAQQLAERAEDLRPKIVAAPTARELRAMRVRTA